MSRARKARAKKRRAAAPPGSAAPAVGRIETGPSSGDSRVEPARRRAGVAKATLGTGGALIFGAAMLFARVSYGGHPKRPPRPLAAPPRFVSIVRQNLLQAGIVAPAQAPPGATTSVS